MNSTSANQDYDAIIIGSGTGGACIAQALAQAGQKVLILERGGYGPLKETFMGIVAIADQVMLGEGKLSTVRAITTGGSTSMYFGVVNYPPLDLFRTLGMDLAPELDALRQAMPINPLPDSLLTAQATALREAAVSLGHDWKKNDMLVDLAKCPSGYAYEAKWKARTLVEQAVQDGAHLVTRATVSRIIIENQTAVGVGYRVKTGPFSGRDERAFGRKIILAAGETASPAILRACGVPGVGARGFFCNPGSALFGLVPGLDGKPGFVGNMSCAISDEVELGDANMPPALYRPMMLGVMKLRHMLSYPECIGIGVKVKDSLSGELRADGRLYKGFDADDLRKMAQGKEAAIKVLERAGASHIIEVGPTAAGRVGGLIRIGEQVDNKLETPFRHLHVCDGSVIPDEMRGTPTLTLLCMARYLARHLLAGT